MRNERIREPLVCGNIVVFVEKMTEESERSRVAVLVISMTESIAWRVVEIFQKRKNVVVGSGSF